MLDRGYSRYVAMWILQSSQDDPAVTFRLRPGTIKTVGRATRADFIVDAALVSRVHCRLTATADVVEVVDLSSTNGTFVNDKRGEEGAARRGRPSARRPHGADDRQETEVRVLPRGSRGCGAALFRASQHHSAIRNGFARRSSPIVVLGPWPGWTLASSPNAKSTVRIDPISVW